MTSTNGDASDATMSDTMFSTDVYKDSKDDLAHDQMHDLDLHASDFTPSPTETHHLKSILHDQTRSLTDLTARIHALELHLQALKADRESLITASTLKSALLAPVRKLPPETLGDIFYLCASSSTTSTSASPPLITPSSPPILLAQVCKRWRRIAHGTPQLWTTIALEHAARQDPLRIIQDWLPRSGALPLDIYLGEGLERTFTAPQHASRLAATMRLLGAHFHRCRSFHVTNAFPVVLPLLFPEGHTRDASLLRDFRVIPSTLTHPPRPLLLGAITAPRLELIDVYRPAPFFHSLALDYSRLRSLRWNTSPAASHAGDAASSLAALAQVLELCPNLEECEIVHPCHAPHAMSPPVVTVPSLRRLRISFTLQVDPTPLLSILRTPNLESLTLEQTSPISNVPGFGGAVAGFLRESGAASLVQLRVQRVILSAEDVPLLEGLAGLKSLQLHNCFLHAGFVAALGLGVGNNNMGMQQGGEGMEVVQEEGQGQMGGYTLPKLEAIELYASLFTMADMVGALERRMSYVKDVVDAQRGDGEVHRLKSVTFSQCRLSTEDRMVAMKLGCLYEGLDVRIEND